MQIKTALAATNYSIDVFVSAVFGALSALEALCDYALYKSTFYLLTYLLTIVAIHRVTVTLFRSISMPAGFHRHFVGKTLRSRYLKYS